MKYKYEQRLKDLINIHTHMLVSCCFFFVCVSLCDLSTRGKRGILFFLSVGSWNVYL